MGIYSNWKLRISNLDCRRMVVITHGVGAMRRYCIGASLFDLDDPSEIGRLKNLLSLRRMGCTLWFILWQLILYLWGRGYARIVRCIEKKSITAAVKKA
jgi:hypothetical protein